MNPPPTLPRRFLLAALHILVAWSLTVLSLYLVKVTHTAALPLITTLFVSVPVALSGVLYIYFGGYREIPGVVWILLGMLLGAGVTLLVSTLFV